METYSSDAVESILKDSEKWAEQVIRENMDLLENIKNIIDYQPDNAEDDIRLIKHINNLKKETKESDKYQKLSALCSAYTILRITSNLNLSAITDMELLLWFYYIGRAVGSSKAFDIEQLEESIHRKRSQRIVKERRWNKYQPHLEKIKAEIRRLAEHKYENGCEDYHHDLANKFKKKEGFKDISMKILRKEIGAIAEPYGKKFGVKKNKRFYSITRI